ncbi:hypothetical protein AB0K45_11035 [Micrococcus luteus]|uniref:hypothetical protein n=1 Tax=Micrococcus luteus TaxID=1270 RepID=UPI0034140CC5
MSRNSMLASVVDDDELTSEWHRLVGAEQAVLDLRLSGAGVEGHSTRADTFAAFVSSISRTVQRAAREQTGRKRYPRDLLIEGASPGSVRLVLRAPTPRIPPHQVVDDLTAASTVDSDALRLIATIIAHADDVSEDSVLAAAVQALPPMARVPLRKAMDRVQKAGWEIGGSISQRGFGYNRLKLTSRGAVRLRAELEARFDRKYTEEVFGTVAGSKDIEGVLWFDPEGGTQFRARVDDAQLRRQVVRYQLDHPRVLAKFDVVESHISGVEDVSTRTARTLRAITLAPLGEQTTIDGDD